MVKMMMRPDYGGEMMASDVQARSVGVEDFGYVLLRADCSGCFYELDGVWGVVLPVATDAEIKQNMLAAMGYEEAVDRGDARFNAFDLWAPKNIRVDAQRCLTIFRERECLKESPRVSWYDSTCQSV